MASKKSAQVAQNVTASAVAFNPVKGGTIRAAVIAAAAPGQNATVATLVALFTRPTTGGAPLTPVIAARRVRECLNILGRPVAQGGLYGYVVTLTVNGQPVVVGSGAPLANGSITAATLVTISAPSA